MSYVTSKTVESSRTVSAYQGTHEKLKMHDKMQKEFINVAVP